MLFAVTIVFVLATCMFVAAAFLVLIDVCRLVVFARVSLFCGTNSFHVIVVAVAVVVLFGC